MELITSRVHNHVKLLRERNYQVLRTLIIEAMREREGRLHIDHVAATDIAWHLAERLPDYLHLELLSGEEATPAASRLVMWEEVPPLPPASVKDHLLLWAILLGGLGLLGLCSWWLS